MWYRYVDDRMYKRRITFVVGGHDDFIAYVRKKHPTEDIEFAIPLADLERDIGGAESLSIEMQHYIWFPEWRRTNGTIAMVCHETLHVALNVLRDVGCRISDDSIEAVTYYHQWLLQAGLNIFSEYEKRAHGTKGRKRSRR